MSKIVPSLCIWVDKPRLRYVFWRNYTDRYRYNMWSQLKKGFTMSFNRKRLHFVDNTDKQVLSIVLTNMCTHVCLLINCPLLLDLWKPWLWSRIISNTMSKLEHFERFPSNGNYLIVSLFQISVKETCPRSISPIRGQNTPPPSNTSPFWAVAWGRRIFFSRDLR